jgi:hypothetical protein
MMALLGFHLELDGWRLRSGGAPGADKAFASLVKLAKDIYPPWNNFEGNPLIYPVSQTAIDLAGALHPAWDNCARAEKLLHGRNSYQVLGHSLDVPSEFVVCWTPDACKYHATRNQSTGGTGTAISLAVVNGIPVFNLADPIDLDKVKNYLNMAKIRHQDKVKPFI